MTGTGTITDSNVPTITHVGDTDPAIDNVSVPEGTAAVFTVNLSNASTTSTSFALNLASGTATLGEDFTNSLTFSNGVVLNQDGTVTVPAGVTSFTVSVPTVTDSTYEQSEGFSLTVGDVTGTGTITDDDTTPIANDDPSTNSAGYSVSIGAVSGINSWDNEDSNGQTVTVTAYKADGTSGTVKIGSDLKLGVADSPRTLNQVKEQIEFNDQTQQSEAVVFSFSGQLNEATVTLANLFTENRTAEVAKWTAMYDDAVVATGTVTGIGSGAPSFTIDTGSKVFNQIKFEALEYADNNSATGGADSSDFFVHAITGSGPAIANGAYVVNEDETLDTSTLSVSNSLLNNDTDIEGDALSVINVVVNGTSHSVSVAGTSIILDKGELVIKQDGTFTFTPNAATQVRMNAGDVETQSFTYTIQDVHGNSLVDGSATDSQATATITIIGKSANVDTPPSAGASNVVTCEDVSYTFKITDFAFSDKENSALYSVRIDSLPTDGDLLLSGEALTVGMVVSAQVITDGNLRFVPGLNESGRNEYDSTGVGDQKQDYSTFQFSVSDGTNWSASSGTMSIDVTPVADKPLLSIQGTATKLVTIDATTVTSTNTGYSVKAFDSSGNASTISIITGTNHDGFGVASTTSGGSNQGAASEIGFDTNKNTSEVISVAFDSDVITVDVSFAWKHSYTFNGKAGETAVVSFFKDGQLVSSTQHNGGTDKIDGPFTLSAQNGEAFDEIRFSSLGEGDDYLIHELRYTSVEVSTTSLTAESGSTISLTLAAELVDKDGSESIKELIVSDLVTGMVLFDGTHTFTATTDATSVDVLGWNLSNLKLTTPSDFDGTTQLKVTAMTQESLADDLTSTPENCPLTAKETVTFGLTIVPEVSINRAPTSTDDNVIICEDTALVLSISDFGTYADADSNALASIKLISLPDATVGVITLDGTAITAGEIISVADITAGKLVFTPSNDSDKNGSFTFQVSDGQAWSQTYTNSVVVKASADTPEASILIGGGVVHTTDSTQTLAAKTVTSTFSEVMGAKYGDDVISGTRGQEYLETATTTLDFGAAYAGKAVTISMNADISGTWNQGDKVFDDYWSVTVNGVTKTYKYGDASNKDVSSADHSVVLTTTLDTAGKATLNFAAATTEKAEIVKVSGVTGVVAESTVTIPGDGTSTVVYPVTLSAKLADVDGSEALTVVVTGVPENGTLSEGSRNTDGSWTVPLAQGSTTIQKTLSITVPQGTSTFTLGMKATAIEKATGDEVCVISTDAFATVVVDLVKQDLPNAISHVKYFLTNGTTVKIDNYTGDIKDPSDPSKFIAKIESLLNSIVTKYVIKAATSVYSQDGVKIGDAVANGNPNDELTNDANVTYTLIDGKLTDQTGRVVDGIIEGLAYITTSGLSGLTDANGSFNYRDGDSVTFMVGNVVIGTATATDLVAGIVFLQDLADVSRSDLNNEYVENMAVFLQSLDSDKNADNGITIASETLAKFENVSLNLATASEAEVKAAIQAAGHVAISEEQAMAHVKAMLQQYAGLTEFEEHIDDSIKTATLATEPLSGLTYVTSSGMAGELIDGLFHYDEGDTIQLFVGDQVVASFDGSAVTNGVISFAQAGFSMTLEELQTLLSPPVEEQSTELDPVQKIGDESELETDEVKASNENSESESVEQETTLVASSNDGDDETPTETNGSITTTESPIALTEEEPIFYNNSDPESVPASIADAPSEEVSTKPLAASDVLADHDMDDLEQILPQSELKTQAVESDSTVAVDTSTLEVTYSPTASTQSEILEQLVKPAVSSEI